jgi:hypothetical protein
MAPDVGERGPRRMMFSRTTSNYCGAAFLLTRATVLCEVQFWKTLQRGPLMADCVEKVLSCVRTDFLRAADALGSKGALAPRAPESVRGIQDRARLCPSTKGGVDTIPLDSPQPGFNDGSPTRSGPSEEGQGGALQSSGISQ